MVGRVAMAARSVIATPDAGMTVPASIQMRLRLSCTFFSTTPFPQPEAAVRRRPRDEFGADQSTRAGLGQDHDWHLHYLGECARVLPVKPVRCRADWIRAHEVHSARAIGAAMSHEYRRGKSCRGSSQCDEGSVLHACLFEELRETQCEAKRTESCQIRRRSSKRDCRWRLFYDLKLVRQSCRGQSVIRVGPCCVRLCL